MKSKLLIAELVILILICTAGLSMSLSPDNGITVPVDWTSYLEMNQAGLKGFCWSDTVASIKLIEPRNSVDWQLLFGMLSPSPETPALPGAMGKPKPKPKPQPKPQRETKPGIEPDDSRPTAPPKENPSPPPPPPPPPPPAEEPPDYEEPDDSLTGQMIEFVQKSIVRSEPGGGTALRYPYKGHVTKVLADNGEYIRVQFGSKRGWVPHSHVKLTTKKADYYRIGWQWMSGADAYWLQKSPAQSGYNIYAPVMYYVNPSSTTTRMKNFTSANAGNNQKGNLAFAQEQGYQTWLTFQYFGSNPGLSTAADRTAKVEAVIGRALQHDVDGINIDYENLGSANRAYFTAFIKELNVEAKKYNLTLSVDIVRPASGSSYAASYDRPALAQNSDYLILMAYDQHWSAHQTGGSVASLPWTESSITAVLNEGVPASKLILGIPFYSRNWVIGELTPTENRVVFYSTNSANRQVYSSTSSTSQVLATGSWFSHYRHLETVTKDGKTWHKVQLDEERQGYIDAGNLAYYVAADQYYKRVRSFAFHMEVGLDIVNNYDPETKTSWFTTFNNNHRSMTDVTISYNAATGQNFVEYTCDDGHTNRIWLEDFDSLRKRRQLMEKYKLPGLAAWSLEWMDNAADAWNELKQ